MAYALPEARPETFRLEKDGPWLGLALDKQWEFELKRPCVFLISLAGDFRRCGLYADRPQVCRVYPMVSDRGDVRLRDKALCPDGAWPRSEQLQPYWRATLQLMDNGLRRRGGPARADERSQPLALTPVATRNTPEPLARPRL